MIHQCLLAAWIVLAITWFVWETWLRDGVEEVNAEAHDQPHQPPTSDQQVSSVTYLHTAYLYYALSSHTFVLYHSWA